MTMTPIATIADALIDFILSLLRDPAAAADYQKDPEASLAGAGLGNACLADVRSVAPVIYDRPDVVVRDQPSSPSQPSHPSTPVQQAISNIVNNFSVTNRSTVVDQSVNQSIYAHGDVNQLFDQKAVLNTGDYGVAAGHDASVDNSTTDVGHDVNVGNTTDTTTTSGSYNDNSDHSTTDNNTAVTDSFNDNSDHVNADDSTVVIADANDANHSDASTTPSPDASADTSTSAPADDTSHDDSSDTSSSFAATDDPTDSSDTSTDSTPHEDLFVDDQP